MVTFDYKKTPITQIADYIIMYSSKSGASDIHFDPRDDGLMVRIRVDGDLSDYTLIPKDYERNLTTRLKLLANMNITESRLPQDGAIKGTYGGQYLDMRVSCLPTNEGEKIVIRILDYTRSLQGLEHLGFSHENFLKLKRMIEVPNGIILVTGATGTGKSTTTYSILQALNKPEKNIITVEDPVEMNIEGLNQVQVNSEIGLDFATVLRSILRQDPNIILIGEIRDSETAKIAVRASITGHLVLSTIHTNDSLSTIERLLDMEVERYLLSSALTGIISQRLAKMLCPKCKKERETTPYEKKVFKRVLNKDIEKIYTANEDGCKECHKGYKGRIAVQEVLEIDEIIRSALNDTSLTKEEMREMVYTSNVITMLQDGLTKVLEGITSFEEIYRIIDIDDDMEKTSEISNNLEKTETKNEDTSEDNITEKPSIEIEIPTWEKDEENTNINNDPIPTNDEVNNEVQIPNWGNITSQSLNEENMANENQIDSSNNDVNNSPINEANNEFQLPNFDNLEKPDTQPADENSTDKSKVDNSNNNVNNSPNNEAENNEIQLPNFDNLEKNDIQPTDENNNDKNEADSSNNDVNNSPTNDEANNEIQLPNLDNLEKTDTQPTEENNTDKSEVDNSNTATLEPINNAEENKLSDDVIQDASNANISTGAKSIITETQGPSTATITPISNSETATIISSHHASLLSKNLNNDINNQIKTSPPLMPTISLPILDNKKLKK